MRLAGGVLAILVLPVLVAAVSPDARGVMSEEGLLYRGTLYAYVAAAVIVGAVLRARAPKRGQNQSIDERATGRYLNSIALFAALVTSVMALLFGQSRLSYVLLICGVAVAWSLLWIPSVMRRVGIKTSVVINCDPATVFAFVSDMRNAPKYIPQYESVEKITEGDIGPGTQFRSRVCLPSGEIFEGVEEIVDYEWAHRLTERVASGRRPNVGVMTFEPDQAATLLSYRFQSEVTYAGALLGEGLLRWIMSRDMSARRKVAWASLKRVLESPVESRVDA